MTSPAHRSQSSDASAPHFAPGHRAFGRPRQAATVADAQDPAESIIATVEHSSERRPKPSLNDAYYFWRRNSWVVDPRFYAVREPEKYIDRPVFLVGNQGDGLTLVSRMLRRGGELVSVSGGGRYWSGADEMHRAMAGYLPSGLSSGGRFIGGAPRHPVLTPPRSWSYASDDLLSGYRRTAGDANPSDRKRLMRAIAGSVRRHGKGRPVRFIDKSQTYTVRLGYLNRLLEETKPAFVLVTRDPYASIYRAATGKAGDMERYRAHLSLDERFELCVQHWENSMRCVEEDEPGLDTFTTVRFEDFLIEPEQSLRQLCGFLDLEFRREMIPAAGQQVPFGTRFETRWYPLRADVNDRYRSSIPDDLLDRLIERIGERAATMGYRPPDRS